MSSDSVDKHIHLFDRIAPAYGLFYRMQVRNFRRLLAANPVCLTGGACTILDIGCGTGALLLSWPSVATRSLAWTAPRG